MDKFHKLSAVNRFSAKKIFLASIIISLIIIALVAIFIFIFGNFGETEIRILFTTFIIGGYSLTGLCSSVLYDKKKYLPLAFSGIIVSILGFLITTGAVWDVVPFDTVWDVMMIFIVLAFSISHSSLLLLAISEKRVVNISAIATIVFVVLVALMLIYLILTGFYIAESSYYRILGVFAIFDVLGTIITPILRKIDFS